MERCEIVYRMDADASIDGIAVHEVADVMYAFAETVDEAMKIAGETGQLKVNVRPFKQGSFITEFVITYQQAASLFSSQEMTSLATILGILGFCGCEMNIPKIVKKVRGRIDQCRDNGDGTYTYGEGESAETVDKTAHEMIQSPKIAKALKTVTVGPLININKTINVTIQSRDEFDRGDAASGSTFNSGDVEGMESYAHIAIEGIPEEKEDVTTSMHNVVLHPVAGRYDGGENGYTFMCGGEKWNRVQIHDLEFRQKLERGDVRFMQKDVLFADVEAVTSLTKSGRESVTRSIMKVRDYRPYKAPQQLSIEGQAKEAPEGD